MELRSKKRNQKSRRTVSDSSDDLSDGAADLIPNPRHHIRPKHPKPLGSRFNPLDVDAGYSYFEPVISRTHVSDCTCISIDLVLIFFLDQRRGNISVSRFPAP